MKVEILYQNAAGKTRFDHEINLTDFPKARKLKVDDEIKMGEYGTPCQNDFFSSDIHAYAYDFDIDHNILEVSEIITLDIKFEWYNKDGSEITGAPEHVEILNEYAASIIKGMIQKGCTKGELSKEIEDNNGIWRYRCKWKYV